MIKYWVLSIGLQIYYRSTLIVGYVLDKITARTQNHEQARAPPEEIEEK